MQLARTTLGGLREWDPDSLERELRALLEREELSARKVLQPIRVAISGSTISPGIFESLAVLGRERSLDRIDAALERLSRPDASADSDPSQVPDRAQD
jgi:glutamyl-tRNA synthetase